MDQETLIEFLHDLGVVLSFRKDRRLQDTQVRNPKWVTKGVYTIVESQLVKDNNGILELDMLDKILDNTAYPPHKHLFIIDMMRKFELCYDIIPDKKFLVPGSLPEHQPLISDMSDTLNFQYKYEAYFGSIISRFIVKMHNRIDSHFVWRKGVILQYKDNKALVKADQQEKTITISITGNKFISRDFLSMIRDKFDEIHSNFSMKIEERIPILDHPGFFEDYQHLLDLEVMRIETIVPRGLKQIYSVRKLLNNIESEDQRQIRQERRLQSSNQLDFYKNSSELITEDKSKLIIKLQDKITKLENEIEVFNKKKQECENVAKFKARFKSTTFLAVFGIIVFTVLYFVIYSSNPNTKLLLSAFSIALVMIATIWSIVNLKEWSPSKFPEYLYEKEKKKLYERFEIDEIGLSTSIQELNETKKNLDTLLI